MKREERIERLSNAWGEYLVASSATSLLEGLVRLDPSHGSAAGWRVRDLKSWRSNLEATFLIRMYAEFEAGLRDVWRGYYRQTTRPPMKDLLDAISTRRIIPESTVGRVNEVRLYRNHLIHEESEDFEIVPLDEARAALSRFLGRLPFD